jgi:hypothetical protein
MWHSAGPQLWFSLGRSGFDLRLSGARGDTRRHNKFSPPQWHRPRSRGTGANPRHAPLSRSPLHQLVSREDAPSRLWWRVSSRTSAPTHFLNASLILGASRVGLDRRSGTSTLPTGGAPSGWVSWPRTWGTCPRVAGRVRDSQKRERRVTRQPRRFSQRVRSLQKREREWWERVRKVGERLCRIR